MTSLSQTSVFPPSLSVSHSLIQSKEEVMAVRLREADSMAAMAELRQKIAELELQVCVCAHACGFSDALTYCAVHLLYLCVCVCMDSLMH